MLGTLSHLISPSDSLWPERAGQPQDRPLRTLRQKKLQ